MGTDRVKECKGESGVEGFLLQLKIVSCCLHKKWERGVEEMVSLILWLISK